MDDNCQLKGKQPLLDSERKKKEEKKGWSITYVVVPDINIEISRVETNLNKKVSKS